MLNRRTANILTAAVKEFISTGEPVSSDWLYKHYDFGIRPAMIRLELNALSDAGYLIQPHHAAGRIPTDMGYEFYVQHIFSENMPANCAPNLVNLFNRRAWPEFLKEFSSELSILGAASVFPEGTVYKSMLTNLIDCLDWSVVELRSLVHDFENLDKRMAAMHDAAEYDDIKVFIGRKSPITKSENLAVMAANYKLDGNKVFICAIGPKTMDYRKAARVMKGLKLASNNIKFNKKQKND